MQQQSSTARRGTWCRCALAALAAGTVACVLALATPAPADPDGNPPPQPFLSGSERSLVILRDIKDVLERIDSRLQRMEDKVARMAQAAPVSQGAPAGTWENSNGGER